jgi:hypothetical protein
MEQFGRSDGHLGSLGSDLPSPTGVWPRAWGIPMDTNNDVLRALGKIEGRLDGLDKRFDTFEKLAERVYKLEIWQSFLKGG